MLLLEHRMLLLLLFLILFQLLFLILFLYISSRLATKQGYSRGFDPTVGLLDAYEDPADLARDIAAAQAALPEMMKFIQRWQSYRSSSGRYRRFKSQQPP